MHLYPEKKYYIERNISEKILSATFTACVINETKQIKNIIILSFFSKKFPHIQVNYEETNWIKRQFRKWHHWNVQHRFCGKQLLFTASLNAFHSAHSTLVRARTKFSGLLVFLIISFQYQVLFSYLGKIICRYLSSGM